MKRILTCILSVIMVVSTFAGLTVFAGTEPEWTIESKNAQVGETVDVNINVVNNPGFNAASFRIEYDTTRLTLKKVKLADEYAGMSSAKNLPNFTFLCEEDVTTDGVMLTMTFEVIAGAPTGDAKIDISYDPDNITNFNEDVVGFKITAGKITVVCDHEWAATPVDLGDGTHGIKCTKCGEAKDIEAHKGGTATCTTEATCEICGVKYGEKLKHIFGIYNPEDEGNVYKDKDATCTSGATYFERCATCGTKGTKTFVFGGPIAHDPSTEWESDATGHWKKCQLGCGIKLNGEGGTGVVAHTYTANYDAKYLKDEADCKSDEVYWLSCSVCGFSAKDDTSKPENERIKVKPNTKKDHEYEEYTPDESATTYKKSDATCQHKATYYKRCKYCKEQGTETFEYGELAAHNFETYNPNDSTTVYKASDATCKEAAKYYKKCSVCDKQGAETFSYGSTNPDNHDYTGATITDLGDGTHGIKCNLCGVAKDVENHEGGTATCIKKAECSKCHAEYGDYAAHKYVEKVDDKYLKDAATCTKPAVYYKSCSVCGEKGTETFEYGDLAPHANVKLVNVKAATEEEEGYTGDEKCLDCDKVIKTGHNIAKLVHEPKKVEAKAATAASEGNKEHYYCENCGKYYLDDRFETEVTRDDVVIAKLKPAIVDKDKQDFAKGSAGSIGFNSSAAYEDFSGVKVDGKDVDPSNYDVVKNEDGTLRVVFKSAYLETLGAGNHTVSIVSVSGSADTEFTVSAAANVVNESKGTSPKTGDLSNIFFWAVMALAAVFGVFTAVYVRKKVVNR